MKGFFSFIAILASIVAALFLADGGYHFVRENRRKYVSLKDDKIK